MEDTTKTRIRKPTTMMMDTATMDDQFERSSSSSASNDDKNEKEEAECRVCRGEEVSL